MSPSTPVPVPIDPRDGPPLPLVGRWLEPLYRAVVDRRNRAFDAGRGVTRFGVPILSVGNLSVGGTGKTPMVRTLVAMLRERGRTPAIAMRGYKARPGRKCDEEAEYEYAIGDAVPVVAQPDRTQGIGALLERRPDVDTIVLDDGFQHRYVARDLDIVLVDATRSPFDDRCLPAGWLREPVASLVRADLVVLTRTDLASTTEIERRLARFDGLPVATSTHAWTELEVGEGRVEHLDALAGRPAIVACAIGHPTAFVEQCKRSTCDVEEVVVKPDHHDWTAVETHRLEHKALACDGVVLTTGKDWVKLREHVRTPMRFVRPRLRLTLGGPGEAVLGAMLDRVLG